MNKLKGWLVLESSRIGKMAFVSSLRRSLLQSSALQSSYSTLTSPKLFVSGLSRQTTDEKLKEAFSPFGQLVEAKVVAHRGSGISKGYGFVMYTTMEEAEKAREEMNAKFLDGWVIFIEPAKLRDRRRPPPTQSNASESGYTVNKTIGWCG